MHQFWLERSPRSYARDSHPRFGYIPLADGVTQRAGRTTAIYLVRRLDPQTFPVNMSGSGPYVLPKLPTQLHIYSVNPVSWLNSAVICFLNKNHTKSARPLQVSNYLYFVYL
jgi:hypothetical protein